MMCAPVHVVLVVCAGIKLAGCCAAAHMALLHGADPPDAATWAQLPAGACRQAAHAGICCGKACRGMLAWLQSNQVVRLACCEHGRQPLSMAMFAWRASLVMARQILSMHWCLFAYMRAALMLTECRPFGKKHVAVHCWW
jgi:hypothetical protein